MSAAVHHVTSAEDFDALLRANTFVVVDFSAQWCPPCKAIAPVYDGLARAHAVPGALAFASVDVDAVPEVAQRCAVTAMPTFMWFRDGQPGPVAVSGVSASQTVQAGPAGVELIRGADPRALTAVVTELGRIAKLLPSGKGGETVRE